MPNLLASPSPKKNTCCPSPEKASPPSSLLTGRLAKLLMVSWSTAILRPWSCNRSTLWMRYTDRRCYNFATILTTMLGKMSPLSVRLRNRGVSSAQSIWVRTWKSRVDNFSSRTLLCGLRRAQILIGRWYILHSNFLSPASAPIWFLLPKIHQRKNPSSSPPCSPALPTQITPRIASSLSSRHCWENSGWPNNFLSSCSSVTTNKSRS